MENKYPKLTGIMVYCPKLEKEIILEKRHCHYEISGWEFNEPDSDYDSGVIIEFSCECGEYHKIEL